MKSVLISIQPKNVANIFNGIKKFEIRKRKPKLEAPFKCLIYCTNDKKVVLDQNGENFKFFTDKNYGGKHYFNGKVVGEFICDYILHSNENAFIGNKPLTQYILRSSCLTMEEINQYRQGKNIYAWHITNLKIYDEPKEIWDFFNYNKYQICNERNCIGCFSDNCWTCWNNPILKRPPQSWCYVWEFEQ